MTTFVYSDGREELWTGDNWKLDECLSQVEKGAWVEFSIEKEKEIIRIPITVTFSS